MWFCDSWNCSADCSSSVRKHDLTWTKEKKKGRRAFISIALHCCTFELHEESWRQGRERYQKYKPNMKAPKYERNSKHKQSDQKLSCGPSSATASCMTLGTSLLCVVPHSYSVWFLLLVCVCYFKIRKCNSYPMLCVCSSWQYTGFSLFLPKVTTAARPGMLLATNKAICHHQNNKHRIALFRKKTVKFFRDIIRVTLPYTMQHEKQNASSASKILPPYLLPDTITFFLRPHPEFLTYILLL